MEDTSCGLFPLDHRQGRIWISSCGVLAGKPGVKRGFGDPTKGLVLKIVLKYHSHKVQIYYKDDQFQKFEKFDLREVHAPK